MGRPASVGPLVALSLTDARLLFMGATTRRRAASLTTPIPDPPFPRPRTALTLTPLTTHPLNLYPRLLSDVPVLFRLTADRLRRCLVLSRRRPRVASGTETIDKGRGPAMQPEERQRRRIGD